ncbi:MAG: FGGY-family carbohydrate kinase [Archaeoglobaceae archaeon]
MIMVFDVGTTTIKAALVENYRTVEFVAKRAKVLHDRERAEVDVEELWEDILDLASQLSPERVEALVFSPHMAGVVPVDREGNALRNAMIWLDERAAGFPRELFTGFPKISGYNAFKLLKFLRITGGAPSKTGKDPLSKMIWLRENEPEVYGKAYKFLDVKGYLIARACGKFVTSPDEASLTWLADTRNGRAVWCSSLLKDFGIDAEKLPEIRSCASVAGVESGELGLRCPVIVGAGDLTAAAVGSGAVEEGKAHVYIGTSDWVAAHVKRRIVDVFHYIGSIMSAIDGVYLLVAEQEVAGGALEWLMKLLNVDYEEVTRMARKETKVLFLPWLFGERAPVDDPHVRGAFLNISLDSGGDELVRAVLEGVALNIRWALGYVERLIGVQRELNAIGGGVMIDEWCQILADVLARPIVRMKDPQQAGIRGSAAIAMVALGKDTFELAAKKFERDTVFKPENPGKYERKFAEFVKAYKKLKGTFRTLSA